MTKTSKPPPRLWQAGSTTETKTRLGAHDETKPPARHGPRLPRSPMGPDFAGPPTKPVRPPPLPPPRLPPPPPPRRLGQEVLDEVLVVTSLLPPPPPPSEPKTAPSNDRVARYRMLYPIVDQLDEYHMTLLVQLGIVLLEAQEKRDRQSTL